ncbi:hypothetical protein [Ensifer sesbaniae]|uniref:hypothetical protein n=1 Tax=Ensifer sesbaniae TaxID=1214071 RepID=UPI0015687FB2|nr:hypothetical protein [Ensifer sesbaniae]NRQ15588.1 hypothetical protein [Ensifer sesbaniae]
MTAINVLRLDGSVTIITDTRARSHAGPDFDAPKVMPIPHMRLAIATRGKMDVLTKVVGAVCVAARDYDSARDFLREHFEGLGLGPVDIFLAGWSKEGPAACIISSVNGNADIPYIAATPMVPGEVLEAFGADPVANMPALLQAQHAANSAVGGYINVTTVWADRIESYTAGAIEEVRRAVVAPVSRNLTCDMA